MRNGAERVRNATHVPVARTLFIAAFSRESNRHLTDGVAPLRPSKTAPLSALVCLCRAGTARS